MSPSAGPSGCSSHLPIFPVAMCANPSFDPWETFGTCEIG